MRAHERAVVEACGAVLHLSKPSDARAKATHARQSAMQVETIDLITPERPPAPDPARLASDKELTAGKEWNE